MPDRSEVEQALAAVIAGALYPGGTGAASVLGMTCRVYRGWPVVTALEADLMSGFVHVTVQPVSGTMRDTTRYSQEWQGSVPAPTLVAATSEDLASFSGGAAGGQLAGVLVDGRAYAYRVQDGDTSEAVAATLAGLIQVDRPAKQQGASVLLVGARGLAARVVSDGLGGQELRRQQTGFRVTAWCPDPATRDQVGAFVDLTLAGLTFLDVSGWGCRVRPSGGSSSDEGSAGGIWRRDLMYSIEYPTTAESSLASMLFGVADVNGVTTTV